MGKGTGRQLAIVGASPVPMSSCNPDSSSARWVCTPVYHRGPESPERLGNLPKDTQPANNGAGVRTPGIFFPLHQWVSECGSRNGTNR